MNENLRHADPVAEWLGAYLDGELNQERRAWVEAHLAGCAACRQELAELRALASLLRDAPEPDLGSAESFSAGVLDALPASSPRGASFPPALRYLPLGLFTAWAALQAAVWIAAALAYLPGLAGRIEWLRPALDLLGRPYIAGLPAGFLLIELLLAGMFAVIFLAWMAGAWSARRALLRAQ